MERRAQRAQLRLTQAYFTAWEICTGRDKDKTLVFSDNASAKEYFELVKAHLERLVARYGKPD